MIAEVAVFGFTVKPENYSYLIPAGLKLQVGQAIRVPFGKYYRQAVVVKISSTPPSIPLKEIAKTVSTGPVIDGKQLRLAKEIAQEYFIPLAQALELFLPRIPKTLTLVDQSIKKSVKQELLLFPTLRQAAAASKSRSGLLYQHKLVHEFDRQWSAVASGQAKIIFGTRSALFAPFTSLKKITIFQTESDQYKEERRPYYRTLDLASKLAKIHQAKLSAVSFSPRVSDHYRIPHQIKKLELLPESEMIDLRHQPIVNNRLLATLKERHGQALLFLNRKSERGPLFCRTCKVTSYTDNPAVCPNCGGADVRFKNFNIASLAKELGPKTAGSAVFSTQQIFYQNSGKFDLVVALSADTYLSQSDYLASEKTFQLITLLLRLVAPGGRLIVQTAHPESHAISAALSGDYYRFYRQELKLRRESGYPPFSKLAKLTWGSKEPLQELELGNLEIFGPFTGQKFPYLVVRGQDLAALNELGRPWKLDIDPVNV